MKKLANISLLIVWLVFTASSIQVKAQNTAIALAKAATQAELNAQKLAAIARKAPASRKAKAEKAAKEAAKKAQKAREKANKAQLVEAPKTPDFVSVEPPLLDSLGYNTLSVRPVHKSDLLSKTTIWRKMDLKEKSNRPWFSEDNQLSKIIVEAVLRGELMPYKDDSLCKQMSVELFKERILDRDAMAASIGLTDKKIYLHPRKLHLIEIKEEVIFDKQRSRTFYDIQSLTMILPAQFNGEKGAESSIATFKYKDLVHVLNKTPNALWYNVSNKAEDKRMSDAFDLRLFSAHIVKVANPTNQYIEEESAMQGNHKLIQIESLRLEHKILADEEALWEY